MTGFVVLDVVIGLVFIYLIYSLLATIIMEIISTWLDLRAKYLAKAVVRMLDDKTPNWVLPWKSKLDKFPMANKFFDHPLLSKMNKGGIYTKPSYISKENFSRVLLDIIGLDEMKPGENPMGTIKTRIDDEKFWSNWPEAKNTRYLLKNFLNEADNDINTFKSHVENWFDDMMLKTTEWYKGNSRLILFIIGLILAATFNIDTVSMTKKLSQDEELRKALVQKAQHYLDTHTKLEEIKAKYPTSIDTLTFKTIQKKSEELSNKADSLIKSDIDKLPQSLGLGWDNPQNQKPSRDRTLLGWLITAFAISMGSNFWFDLLKKLMKIRTAVTDKENKSKVEATTEASNKK